MSRYIDAYEVKRQIQKATEGEVDVMKVFLKAMYYIDMIPPADVVEVVRCKDCKYGHLRDNTKRNSSIYCDFGIGVHKENYCSFGERADK